jgi:hypothetical protein
MPRLAFILVLAFAATSAVAQRGFAAPHFSFNGGRGFSANSYWRAGSSFYPLAVPADAFYGDALIAGYPVAPQPPVVILQPPSGNTAAEPRVTGEPVLIELQGNQYVRLSGPSKSSAVTLDLQPPTRTETDRSRAAVTAHSEPPSAVQPKSAVLIFRDGHREEISDYVITNGTLYAHTSYYTSGSWTKNIDLAVLDVPQTVSFNESQGVRFRLPNAANEVMVGP